MARTTKRKSKRSAKRLYFSAKISDYHFKKVLWQFALDHSAAEAAQHLTLSENSIAAIYGKLRRFFFEHGLFRDPYQNRDPRGGLVVEGFEDVEALILRYHLARVAKKRGRLNAPLNGPDHHFAESNWRFDFEVLLHERGAEPVRPMMYANLLEFVRRFAPVGSSKEVSAERRAEGYELAMEQLDRMALWLERNSVKFRDPGWPPSSGPVGMLVHDRR